MTQKQRILEYLRSGKKLSRLESWAELGILECPARISELRREGHAITTTMIPVYNRYGERVKVAEWRLEA
jgi:hypothetical protein